jgi:hypothetical protein
VGEAPHPVFFVDPERASESHLTNIRPEDIYIFSLALEEFSEDACKHAEVLQMMINATRALVAASLVHIPFNLKSKNPLTDAGRVQNTVEAAMASVM